MDRHGRLPRPRRGPPLLLLLRRLLPAWEDPEEYRKKRNLYLAGDFITDRYVAVRSSLLDQATVASVPPHQVLGKAPMDIDVPPESEPPESTETFLPSLVAPLLKAGIDIRQGGDTPVNDRKVPQPLYHHGQYVGAVMPNSDGVTLDTVRHYMTIRENTADQPDYAPVIDGYLTEMPGSPLDALMKLQQAADQLARRLP